MGSWATLNLYRRMPKTSAQCLRTSTKDEHNNVKRELVTFQAGSESPSQQTKTTPGDPDDKTSPNDVIDGRNQTPPLKEKRREPAETHMP